MQTSTKIRKIKSHAQQAKNVAEKDLKRMQMSIHQINDYKSNVCGQHKNISTK